MNAIASHVRVAPIIWAGSARTGQRYIPSETPVAITYNGTSHAVMMATPDDLEDFGIGFALTEGLVDHVGQIERCETLHHRNGIEVRLWITEERARKLVARRRHMAGPTGCGLCGIESLDEVRRATRPVTGNQRFGGADIVNAVMELRNQQKLNALTRAVHAAAYWTSSEIVAIREDVGRHNALDKLIGALSRQNLAMTHGAVLLTSRVSVELIQKTAVAGCPTVIAVSAPTATALETADCLGMTVVGITRDDGFEIFTHPSRISL